MAPSHFPGCNQGKQRTNIVWCAQLAHRLQAQRAGDRWDKDKRGAGNGLLGKPSQNVDGETSLRVDRQSGHSADSPHGAQDERSDCRRVTRAVLATLRVAVGFPPEHGRKSRAFPGQAYSRAPQARLCRRQLKTGAGESGYRDCRSAPGFPELGGTRWSSWSEADHQRLEVACTTAGSKGTAVRRLIDWSFGSCATLRDPVAQRRPVKARPRVGGVLIDGLDPGYSRDYDESRERSDVDRLVRDRLRYSRTITRASPEALASPLRRIR